MADEINFDGLVGPTHNYAGLAHGNLAAAANKGLVANPREAALQGLAKMREMLKLGLKQGVLPPQERPHVSTLRKMGFAGSDAEVAAAAARASPVLLANASSASAMWTANAATVSPSADASDGRVHFTPANLSSHFHRAIEAEATTRLLRRIFADEARFTVHDPVPFALFGDEGAANHCRFSRTHGEAGVELFVFGHSALTGQQGVRFAARQSVEASHIVATHHRLSPSGILLAQQSRAAIDAGVFHNDVISVSNGRAFLVHEGAFDEQDAVIDRLTRLCASCGFEPVIHVAARADMTLADAVSSYVFNSQIVTRRDGGMSLILPLEARENAAAKAYVQRILGAGGPIDRAVHLDLRQSMRNGGGPACLRLRVVLTAEEQAAMHRGVLLDEAKIAALEAIVSRFYRDRLAPDELGDPALLDESRGALDAISGLLGLEGLYDFQRS
jgi:succinylarginine dihydrolase